LDWDRVRLFDKEIAQVFVNDIKQVSHARYSMSNLILLSILSALSCLLGNLSVVRGPAPSPAMPLGSGLLMSMAAPLRNHCRVSCIQRKEKVKPRPIALNTVEMLRVASSSLGLGPQHTMSVAERLYIQGYISYPRTETTHYPENFDLRCCSTSGPRVTKKSAA